MIARILHVAFYYLSLVPLLSFLILKFIPAGELGKARLILVGCMILAAVPLWLILKAVAILPGGAKSFRSGDSEKQTSSSRKRIWFGIAVALGLAFLLWRISNHTQGMTDAWQMWNMKAKFYFVSFANGLDFRLVMPEWFHPGYPAFFPFQLAGFALLPGDWSSGIPISIAVLYYALIALIFFELVRRIESTNPFWPRTLGDLALLLAIALPVLPGIIMATAEQCADIPLGAFMLYAAYATHEIVGDSRKTVWGSFLLLGLACAAMLHIKNEGVLLMLMVFPVLGWFHKSRLKDPMNAVALVAPMIVSASLLVVFKMNAPELQPYKFQLDRVIRDVLDLSRYAFILKGFLAFQILTAFFAPIVAAVLVFRFRKQDFILLFPLVLNFALYHAFFLVTPEDLPWHWISAYHRINIQIMPAWFYIAAASLGGLLSLRKA